MKGVKIPLLASEPVREFEWRTNDDLRNQITNTPVLDFVTLPSAGFQIAVDDTGLIDGLGLNRRAMIVANQFGYPKILAGDVLFLGVTRYGSEADLPEYVTRACFEVAQ